LALEDDVDWVMWMDCDSFFMDHTVAIHEMVTAVAGNAEKDNLEPMLSEWYKGDRQPLSRFDELLGDDTLGWGPWLLNTDEKHLIASEDGLMLNTGIFFLRRSMWSWRFLQKVRRMTFGASYFFVGNQTDLFSSNFSAFRVHTYLLLPPLSNTHGGNRQPWST